MDIDFIVLAVNIISQGSGLWQKVRATCPENPPNQIEGLSLWLLDSRPVTVYHPDGLISKFGYSCHNLRFFNSIF
jgi:hypothetical protein